LLEQDCERPAFCPDEFGRREMLCALARRNQSLRRVMLKLFNIFAIFNQ
jgi:hypothetical protein